MPLRSVCVFCGSRPGRNPAHAAAAGATGEMLARNGWRLVFGAGDVGLMGEVAKTAMAAGAPTLGVIPVHLLGRERRTRDRAQMVVTKDMHERKQLMFERSDAFVAFPGGVGTLEELVEQMTWSQLGRHSKPILLANIDGFWDPLLALIDHMKRTEFIRANLWVDVLTADRVEDILPKLRVEAAKTPADAKLMDDRVASGL